MKLSTKLLQDRVITLSITIAILIIISSIIWPTKFPTFDNLSLVLLNLSIETIVAVGMMILMISGSFDLSVGSVVAFAGGFTGFLMYYFGVFVPVAILAGMGGAIFIGFINGYLVARVGINPLIQTLAMMGIVRGLALMVSGAGIQNFPESFNVIGQTVILGFQTPVWFMLIIVALFSFLVSKTTFFRKYYYIGGNEKAAKLSGIRVEKMKIYSFILISALAGFAGILLSSRLGAAMSTSGQGMELRVITAVILGGASLLGGQGKIVGAMLGTIFMGLISNVMILARVSGYWQQIILGLILILAVVIDIILKKNVGVTPKKYLKKAVEQEVLALPGLSISEAFTQAYLIKESLQLSARLAIQSPFSAILVENEDDKLGQSDRYCDFWQLQTTFYYEAKVTNFSQRN